MLDSVPVHDLMSRHVMTIGLDDSLERARDIFEKQGFHHLIVIERGKAVGVISDRDLLRNISPFIKSPLAQRSQDLATLRKHVHQIMTRRLVTVAPDSTAAVAAQLMIEQNVSCLPVIDQEQHVVGILTLRDLARWIVEQSVQTTNPS
jgi:acetoin utilization protein AcuB